MPEQLCTDCLKDKFLKTYAEARAVKGTCFICGRPGVPSVHVEELDFQNLFKAVIRYHYGEYAYNSHWGGDSLDYIFSNENPILNHRYAGSADAEELLFVLPREGYAKDSGKEVSIYFGFYSDGSRGLFANNLLNEPSEPLGELERRLQFQNHFQVEQDAIKLLTPLRHLFEKRVSAGAQYYRARIGYAQRFADTVNIDFSGLTMFYKAYEGPHISSPPPPKASAGRLNRPGVSYLYVASNPETAVSEVRPHPGHMISLGKFTLTEDMVVADLSDLDLLKFCTDKLLDSFVLLHNIGAKFAIPIIPEERDKYLITQLFAEVFRQMNFDGVLYKSSVSDGINLVAFSPSLFSYSKDEATVYECRSVNYSLHNANEGVVFDEDDFEEYPS